MAALLALAIAPSHAARPKQDAEIEVQSVPAGATVLIMGKSWGSTPLRLRLKQAFPALYRPEQPYVGMAIYLRKEGCNDYRQPLHRRSIPERIQVELDCEAGVATTAAPAPVDEPATSAASRPAPDPAPAAATPAKRITAPPANISSVRKKLAELDELREAELISEIEYRKLRKRVLEYF